jgi:hypothetical protein
VKVEIKEKYGSGERNEREVVSYMKYNKIKMIVDIE